jgi:uncharacterized protein
MIYHLITTPECNLCCRYCCEKAFDEPDSNIQFEHVPKEPQYSMKQLFSFLEKDSDKPISVIFYGGEPLLNISFIKKVIDYNSQKKVIDNFLLQTNATLLHKLPKEYSDNFHTILASIDGSKKTTNFNRGENTFEKVVSNLQQIKANGFSGELIARMTIEEPTNFFEDIFYLITNKEFSFNSIHWQLDANMWHDYNKRNFSEWIKKYNKDITKLANYWIEQIEKSNFLRLYPFLGIMDSLINKTQYHLRCGSGIGNFTILPNGKISACPIMSGIKEKYLGDLNSIPKKLPFKLTIKEPCVSCPDFELCGGRCLYSNIYPAWPEKGINEICDSIKHLINEMKRIQPRVEKAISQNKISSKDLKFLKYNCCEIIP